MTNPFRQFNDISIRGKLTLIVAAAVCVLTTGVLISVWIISWREVTNDVHNELQLVRHDFAISEGEHLHEHALEAATIAESEELLPFVQKRDSKGACSWLAGILSGKALPVNPEDSIDLLGVILPNGEPLDLIAQGESRCVRGKLKNPLPALTNKQNVSRATIKNYMN